MNYKYRFSKRALKQQEQIIKWYAPKSLKAAENFANGLYQVIEEICTDPFKYRTTYKKFREFYWKKIPISYYIYCRR